MTKNYRHLQKYWLNLLLLSKPIQCYRTDQNIQVFSEAFPIHFPVFSFGHNSNIALFHLCYCWKKEKNIMFIYIISLPIVYCVKCNKSILIILSYWSKFFSFSFTEMVIFSGADERGQNIVQ